MESPADVAPRHGDPDRRVPGPAGRRPAAQDHRHRPQAQAVVPGRQPRGVRARRRGDLRLRGHGGVPEQGHPGPQLEQPGELPRNRDDNVQQDGRGVHGDLPREAAEVPRLLHRQAQGGQAQGDLLQQQGAGGVEAHRRCVRQGDGEAGALPRLHHLAAERGAAREGPSGRELGRRPHDGLGRAVDEADGRGGPVELRPAGG
mmetsp:Transcript_28609/g.75748  ORF Transcript_28609/g.75748 Transcript_28609/m.75748 type:complete len:202 (+) Transcript_28609:507-1112(+)